MNGIDYKRLAQEIVAEQSKEFLSFDDVCFILGCSAGSVVARKVVANPGFPAPTFLVDNGRRRWFKRDVMNWIERERERRSRAALNPVA